jgi:hypothetical protein
MLEKAYAKAAGSYTAIIGGTSDIPMRALTNCWTMYFTLHPRSPSLRLEIEEEIQNGSVWKLLLECHQEGGAICCGTIKQNIWNMGLANGHEYAVLDVRLAAGEYKLIRLRNPWARGEWIGDWSDHSSKWNDKLKKELGWESKCDGSFWMCFDDFVRYYNNVILWCPNSGWKCWTLEGVCQPRRVPMEKRDQWFIQWPQGINPVVFRWDVEVSREKGLLIQMQSQYGKRMPFFPWRGLPRVREFGMYHHSYGSGIEKVTEGLDEKWSMVMENLSKRKQRYIVRLWCQHDLTISEIPLDYEVFNGRS